MRLVKIFCMFLTIWLLIFVTTAGSVHNGAAAPDFSLKDLNGRKIGLSGLKGKIVVLNFWSTTCPPCVAELPSLNALYHDLAKHGLVVLGIALDASDKPVRELAQRLRIEYPVLMDSSQEVYFDSYALFGQPVSILIDRTGRVREKIVGQVDWASPDVRTKMTNLLKGR
jgi:peroxiredoxin